MRVSTHHPTNHLHLLGAVSLIATLGLAGCGSVEDTNGDGADNGTNNNGTTTSDTTDSDIGWEAPEDLDGSVTLYAANPQGLNEELADEFTKATGVDVEIYGDTTGSITARLDAEWDNPQADVVYIASWGPAAAYAKDGHVADYTPEFADSIHEDWRGDGFYGRDGSALALTVNTNAAPSMPGDWEDLTGQEFENLVLMPDPRESGTARDLIAAMVSTWGKDETWELFDELFENGMDVQGANGPALDAVTAGSYAVVLGGVDYSAYSAIEEGESLEVVFADSGTMVSPRPFFILEEAPNRENAEALVDFFLSHEGQTISAEHNMIPAQPEVPAEHVDYDDVDLLDYDLDALEDEGEELLDEFVSRYLS
ncbi:MULTISPECIES: extracellular solute-binding protein [Auritidibacter]|uniref:extracellular solute-binding protein n=1 Tax=Auritidibacter TaxID=1160973 RepID=UPI0018F163FD|nr:MULTISPECIES: extracellular solute-binding protein [Auritidibacter]WGH81350.1 extracellular solute-binding protein [Auritidibacter ignavus]WGH83602.1 extracellular solute-binding protein [Auritidibacter ignavus]WGH90558.1 extracellular solute-binding protein [Auritidibacter ignavus]